MKECRLTDNEIIMTLKECLTEPCSEQAYINAIRNSLDLINRQQAEIESLKIENQSLREAVNSYKLHYNEAKTEAIKEFADRLKALDRLDIDVSYGYGREHYTEAIAVNLIDNLIKEMAGEE